MVRQASGSYTFAQIEAIWIAAGGNKLNAPMAAAIALAESGGNPNATNDNGNGSVDRGLWQINSVHGAQSTYDVTANARAAVQISNNGSSWRPWCTAYSDGLCGTRGGTYLGAGAPFLKFLGSAGVGSAITTANNTNPQSGNAQYASFPTTQDSAWYNWIIPFGLGGSGVGGPDGGSVINGTPLGGIASTIESGIAGAIGDVLKPIGRAILYTLFVVGGVLLMGVGTWLVIKDTDLGSFVAEQGSGSSQDENVEGTLEDAVEGQSSGQGRSSKTPAASTPQQVSEPGLGRHRGQQAKEGRTQKAEKRAKEAAKVAEVAA